MRSVASCAGAVLAGLVLAAAPVGAIGPDDGETREVPGTSPGVALTASAAYPGLGQLLNGNETKALVVGATEAFLIARLVLEDRWTRNAFRLYRQTGEARYFEEYSDHFDRRQTLVWWVVVAGLYSIVDAYVDAHLSAFDEPISPRIGLAGLDGEDPGVRLGIAITF